MPVQSLRLLRQTVRVNDAAAKPQAHLTAFLTGVGYHESAWRLADPGDLSGPARFGVLERAAQTAERGLLDAVFFADSPGLAIFRARYFPQVGFDPVEIIAALSRSTTSIGLIATASTTYSARTTWRAGFPRSIICPAAGPAGIS
jgi:hypothetical protein